MHTSRNPASAPPSSGVSPGEALDLSVSGSKLAMTRRPSSASPGKSSASTGKSSASTGKTFCRSVSVIGERSHKHRNALSDVLGGSRSIKNLRRSNSTTQVHHIHQGAHSPEHHDEYLTLLSSDARNKLSKDATTWNILDDQPRAAPPHSPRSCSSLDSQGGHRRREAAVSLAATFTANNRSNKGAVGNSVTTILHNNHNSDKPLTPKSSNQRPPFNNLLKAHDEVSADAASLTKSQKNFTSCGSGPLQLSSAPHRRREVTEEEAERFIEQVNDAALTIQRWFRRQRQRRRSQPSQEEEQQQEQNLEQEAQGELQRLLSSKRKEWERRASEQRRSEQHKDEDRRRIREEKARLARLQAVQELQQRRAQRSLEPQFNAEETDASRAAVRGKRGSKSGSEPRSHTGVQAAVQAGIEAGTRPESPRDKSNLPSGDAQLNIDFSDLTFRPVSPAPPSHREPTCPQERAEEELLHRDERSHRELIHSSISTQGCRKKPPAAVNAVTTATNRSPAPLSPGNNKLSNTDAHLNIGFSDLTFRAVSPAPPHPQAEAVEEQRAQSKTTLNELLDSLRLLEEEPSRLQPRPHKDYLQTDGDSTSLTADNLQRHVLQSFPRPAGGALLSEAKLQSIMSFLDEMEKSEQERPRSATSQAPLSEDELTGAEQLSSTAAEVSGNMTRIRLELEEKRRTVNLLQAALAQQRELTARHVKETENELNRNFQLQKEQYEATIQRHLAFIDQLISDKKALSDRCEGVVSELKLVDHKYTKKIQQMQEQHDMVWQILAPLCEEIKKLKELMAATEKIRREKWIDEKTKKIKEITVKGLEPEIQRMISKHKQELNKLRSLHEAELLQADERAAQRFIQQTEELRERLQREREEECQRERESSKHRYEKQLQEEELCLQQQRRRLYQEVAQEKDRLAELATRQRVELEELRAQLEENSSVAGRALRQELDKTREEQERRHQMEMKALQERVQMDRQSWEDTCRSKQEVWLRTRERELKEELKKQRDQEIQLAIWTLEEQTSKEREESQRNADNRVRRVREKFETELQELERSERAALEKHQETRQKLQDQEEQLMKTCSELRLKEQALETLTQSCERLTSERRRLEEVIRLEFAERLVQTEEENTTLKNSVSELRARLRLELERVTREKEEELSHVHERVKTAILKKEETVTMLRKQHEAALKRADHLEALWEQQRKQLLQK